MGMTEEELRKFRYEEMRDAFEEMMDLHKRTIILAMELHKAMEEDGDPVGIANSKEFLSLLAQQRNLIIMGMVHKVNVVEDEQAANKLIPFPLSPTRPKLDETLRQYIPDSMEQIAKCHAEIIRMANKVGYFYWPLPKSCSSHVKRRPVTVYDCAHCNVLEQALADIDMTEADFCQLQQEVYQLYRKWLLQIRMLQEHADDRQAIEMLKASGAKLDCIRHVSEEWLEHGRFSGEACHGCLVIRESFRQFGDRKKK
jgi:hypothetical protein